jgi:hypothetical protein
MSIAMKLNQIFSGLAAQRAKTTASTEVNKKSEPAKTETSTTSGLSATTSKHKSGKFFEEIEGKLKQEGAALVAKIGSVIGFQINCDNDQKISYVVDLKTSPGSVFVNDGSVKPSCTITIADEDLLSIMNGKLNMMSVIKLVLFKL